MTEKQPRTQMPRTRVASHNRSDFITDLKPSLLSIVLMVLVLFLSGCMKAQITINVEANGSGTVSLAVGASQQLLAFSGTEGESMWQTLSQELSETSANAAISRRSEAGYEWIEGNIPFRNLDQLNGIMSGNEFFERFSLSRQRGVLKTQFVLDALANPLLTEGEQVEDLLIDPSGFFEIRIGVSLPGEVKETNGIREGDSDTILWTISSSKPLRMYTVSETVNWLGIGILAAVTLATVGLSATGAVLLLTRTSGKEKPAADSPALEKEPPAPSVLAEIATAPTPTPASPSLAPSSPDLLAEAEQLLKQANEHILKGQGVVRRSTETVSLTWPGSGRQPPEKAIVVSVLDDTTVAVNGESFPATSEGIKRGIVSALRELR